MRHLLFLLGIMGFLAGCALPVTEVPPASYSNLQSEIRQETGDILIKYVAAQQRLLSIAGPIWMENAALCPRRAYTTGFVVHSDFDLPDGLRDVAYERMLLQADAKILAVFPGSEAWHAGIRSGDVVMTMNGRRVRNAAELRARLRRVKEAKTIAFGFLRDGRAIETPITLRAMCNYPLTYLEGDRELNAFADGRSIAVTQGMTDFANDRELGAIIGHELAHNIMHHTPKKQVNAIGITVAGVIIDGLAGVAGMKTDVRAALYAAYTHAWSARFEKEADYVGLYLLARAGGDISAAAPFWRKMAAEHGVHAVKLPALMVRTHPDSPERFVILENTRAEIEAKIRQKKPLMPNLSFGFAWGEQYWPWEQTYEADEEPDDRDLNH